MDKAYQDSRTRGRSLLHSIAPPPSGASYDHTIKNASWLHLVPKSLQLRHLASPIIDIKCSPRESVASLMSKVKARLDDDHRGDGNQGLRRASVICGSPSNTISVAVLDDLLTIQNVYRLWTEERQLVSQMAFRATTRHVIDGTTNFVDGMEKIMENQERAAKDDAPFELLVIQERGKYTGVVRESTFLDSVPVRLGVLSFFLELEEALIFRVLRENLDWKSLLSLQKVEEIQNRAEETFGSRLDDSDRLLSLTQFLDKMKIVRKCGWCMDGKSATKFQDRIKKMNDLRNWCAHSTRGLWKIEIPQMLEGVGHAREMITELNG